MDSLSDRKVGDEIIGRRLEFPRNCQGDSCLFYFYIDDKKENDELRPIR